MNEKLSYGVADVVKASGASRSLIYEQIKAGNLKARKLGRRTLILSADLQSWLAALPTSQAGAR
ncbi:helix-turn-helix transcriptional regulator [Methylobacterium sp. CM6257]